jgi:ribose-phosphate pyrophosphokinase
MLVIEGPCGNGIGKGISSLMHSEFAECNRKVFPDGESEVGLGAPVEGKDVLIVQSTYPMQDKRIMELLLLADDARKQGARSVGAVVPYLAYARQDRRFEEKGNAVSIYTVLELLGSVGIATLVTVSPHKEQPLSQFKGKVVIPSITETVAKRIGGAVENPLILAPDVGAIGLASSLAGSIGCEYSNIDKKRDVHTGKVRIMRAPEKDLDGRNVVIADDIISSGSTVAQAALFAYNQGANKVIAMATHLLMSKGAIDMLREAGISEIYGTNTVPCDSKGVKIIDISADVAETIARTSSRIRGGAQRP